MLKSRLLAGALLPRRKRRKAESGGRAELQLQLLVKLILELALEMLGAWGARLC